MCPFIETVRVENGQVYNLHYHNDRMNLTRHAFFGKSPLLDLNNYIVPPPQSGRIKCRVEYADRIVNITYSSYRARPVATLQLVHADNIVYPFKSADRTELNLAFSQRGDFDDVLIVRNGFLTDTSIANLALFDGNRWITPANPLLKGTKRKELISKGVLYEEDIPVSSLCFFSRIALFNALIDFDEMVFPVNRDTIHCAV